MQFIKNFFLHENLIVGLSGLKKKKEYIKINIPESYKKTVIQNTKQNYLLL